MPSPSGSLSHLTPEEFEALRASNVAALTSGQTASLSGGGKSKSKTYTDALALSGEINAEFKRRNGIRRVSKVIQDTSGTRCRRFI